MTGMISDMQPSDSAHVWRLIEQVALNDLHFPAEAVSQYRAGFLKSDARWSRIVRTGDHIDGVLVGTSPEGGVGTIIWLVIDREMRGHGVGSALFMTACERYKDAGCHKIKLTVPSEAAKHFYEKHGMSVEGFHNAHWWHMDFWSMGLIL